MAHTISPLAPKTTDHDKEELPRDRPIKSAPGLNLPPSAVLFDWDNTLVDTWDTIFFALNKTLAAFGHEPWGQDFARANIQHSGREAFPRLFGAQAVEAQKIFYQTIEDDNCQGLRPLEGAETLLQTISSKNIPLGIISNKSSLFLHKDILHLGWGKYFGVIVGAGDAARDKPAPDPLLWALEKLRIPPSPGVWMIGDTPADWSCAAQAQCQPIAIGNHFDSTPYTPFAFDDCPHFQKIFT